MQGEGVDQPLAVPHQRAAAIERGLQPFVRVQRQTVRQFDPLDQPAQGRGKAQEGPDAAVDVEPDALTTAQGPDGSKVINRPGVGRARRGDHAGRLQPRRAILGDHPGKGSHIHTKGVIRWHQPQRLGPKPQHFHRLLMRRMDLIRGIETQRLWQVRHPLGAHIDTGHRIARHRQPDKVGHRPARGQRAPRTFGKTHQPAQPVHHLNVGRRRRRIAAAKVRPVDGSQKIGHRPGEVAAAHVPAEKAWMHVAHRIAHQAVAQPVVDVSQGRRMLRRCGLEAVPDRVRHRLPDRPLAHLGQMGHRVIDHPVRHRARLRPVVGIK